MQKTRSLLWLVAMLIMTALVGCLYEPFDGQVVGQNEKIHFNGYGVDPDSWIQLRVQIPSPQGMRYETLAWARTAHEPNYLFTTGSPQNYFYAYSGDFTLPIASLQSIVKNGRRILGARLETWDPARGTSYMSVRSDGLQCYVDHLANANDYLRDCNAGGTVTLEIR